MTAIDRTAYPRPSARLSREELGFRYDLTETDLTFVRANARGDNGRLLLAVLLKSRRDFGCFPGLGDVHAGIVVHVASQLGLETRHPPTDDMRRSSKLYRYQAAVRAHLCARPYGKWAERLLTGTILDAAETMSDPADLINRAIQALQSAAVDLPGFSTLDRLVSRLRAEIHRRIFGRVAARLTRHDAAALDVLLVKPAESPTTPFNRLKQAPGPATPKTITLWVERLEWLGGLIDPDPLLEGITHTKLRQFAAEAAAMEVSDLLDIAQPRRRHTLLLALLRQARMRCRDELVEMMLRRIRRTQAVAKEQLEALHDQHRGTEEALIGIFGQVLETAQAHDTDVAFGSRVRTLLSEHGGVDALAAQCETVSAWHRNNDLPLLWPIHARHRALLFRLIDVLDIRPATQDCSLLDAWTVVSTYRHARRSGIQGDIDLGFASQRWRSFMVRRRPEVAVDRRALEVSVFIYLADALQNGDLYVVGAENFADYRSQLLPWSECERRLPAYCAALGIPERGEDFTAMLKADLTAVAAAVDTSLPDNTELSIADDGTPHLRQIATTAQPAGLTAFEQELRARMPERHLLDILKHAEHWSRYTRHFGPPSGADRKLAQAVQRYLVTVFGYGCNLGPGQTARHAPGLATAQALRRINAQQINADKLEAAMVDVIDQYARFALPRHWGRGRAAIADGTHVKLRENNLIGSRHIRYGGYGGIAYHHIADSYIALFTSFIPCGVWEAIHILDGLLKNRSAVRPDTLHADTQGQSEPVFGLCRLLGIKLMPRMRGFVPPAVGETPGWSLRGLGRGRKLLGSDGRRWPEAVPLDEPGRVVDLAELDQRVAELLDGVEGSHPEQVLFQSADEALGAAIALRRPHEGGRTLDAEEGEFLLEVIRHVLAAVVVANGQTSGDLLRECCKVTPDALADWLQRLEARRPCGGVDTDTFGRAVVDGDEHRGLPLAGPGRGQVGAPHLVYPVGDDGAVVVAWTPRRADTRGHEQPVFAH